MSARRHPELPHSTTVLPRVWIPMPDGTRLAARLWRPDDSGPDRPVPAILEYHPYRKNDHTFAEDEEQHRYFAGHGYACARVDVRGSGDSDGVLTDEYSPQELADGVEVIRWLAAQDWCTGDVGLIGRSWGGFNGLQLASRRPDPLKAIITIASTDDRYAEDVHYTGGCLIASEMLPWANRMLAYTAQPPDPDVVGDGWREEWLTRMEQSPPLIEGWMRHQRRDDYWRHGSVCEDYDDIRCAVLAVGGWADPYRNAILRLLQHLSAPCKGLIGPWSHITPYAGSPGPLIGFLQEAVRWWDHWLKGLDNGVPDEPSLRAWIAEPVAPHRQASTRPGRWVAEPTWPPAEALERRWYPSVDNLLQESAPESDEVVCTGLQHAGVDGGTWLSKGHSDDFAPDQRAEDGRAVAFTSAPLRERIEILGRPHLSLRIRADQPWGLVAVRLCDVAPDGASLLVTRGLLNLTHRESHEHLEPMQPGTTYDVVVALDAVGHAFVPGHRLRVAVSPTYWPWAWPSPRAVELRVLCGEGSFLGLPLHTPRPDARDVPEFGAPESAAPPLVEKLSAGVWQRRHSYDVGARRHEVRWRLEPDSAQRVNDILVDQAAADLLSIVDDDPLSARVDSTWRVRLSRGEWDTSVEASSTMTSDESTFFITCSLEAMEGTRRVFSKSWTYTIPRDHL